MDYEPMRIECHVNPVAVLFGIIVPTVMYIVAALRSLIGNPSRTFVVFLGIFLGSYIALLGYSFLDTMDNTKQSMVDEMGSYEYQYVLNELVEGNVARCSGRITMVNGGRECKAIEKR